VRLFIYIETSTEIFAKAKFELKCWEYTDPDFEGSSRNAVLGMSWNKKEDTFAVDSVRVENDYVITRRNILSVPQWIYMSRFIVPQAIITTVLGTEGRMDQEVPDDVRKCFLRWTQDLPLLEKARISRWLKGMSERVISCSLHTFCDASKMAFAAAGFPRYECSTCLKVQLDQAKTRVAPVKAVTISRLELLAATIGLN